MHVEPQKHQGCYIFTLAGITNSDFQIYHGDESGPFQEFFENFKFSHN